MSNIDILLRALEVGKIEYSEANAGQFFEVEEIGLGTKPDNYLTKGDNLLFMKYLLSKKGMEEQFQLIYVDPPFFSKASYEASMKIQNPKDGRDSIVKLPVYKDCWENNFFEYLKMLASRFYAMRDLLSSTGCLWVHLDWHAVHAVKLMLDEIFGEENFVNEIIWTYKSGGASKRRFARKHDTLLFYSKTPKYYFSPQLEKSYNRGFKPYRFKGVKEYRDEVGWYTMVNQKDVWSIDMVGRTAGERTGYATQKPEALLSQILESCSIEGDLCGDFFGGSGTLATVAERMNRRWISCDSGAYATSVAQLRLQKAKGQFILLEEGDNVLQKTSNNGAEIPDFDISLTKENDEYSGREMLQVSIVSYRIPSEILNAGGLDKDFMTGFSDGDIRQLLSYWSVDFDCKDGIHRPTRFFFREKGILPYECIASLHQDQSDVGKPASVQKISIRVVDILGNHRTKIFDVT